MGTRRHHRVSGVAVILAGMLAAGAAVGDERPTLWPTAERAAFPGSPYHGARDGDGRVIPCRCRFQGQQYRLGDMVCMSTHVGVVLTRCDLMLNNTSWVPTPCALTLSGSSKAPEQVALAP